MFDINTSTKPEKHSESCSFYVHFHFMLLIWSLILNVCIVIHGTNMVTSPVMIVTRHLILTLL